MTQQLQMPMQIMLIKKVIFKTCAPFTDCKSEINNVETDNAKDINIAWYGNC